MSYLSGYQHRLKLVLDHFQFTTTETNFPALVPLFETTFDFSLSNADGFDIRFTSEDEETLLKYQRLCHDSDNQLAIYFVKIPSCSHTTDTVIYMYYRRTDTADGADPTAVWDDGESDLFKAVYHMIGASTDIPDSTAYANDGTKKSAAEPAEQDGITYKEQEFDRGDDYIAVTDDSDLVITADITLKVAFNANSVAHLYASIVNKRDDSAAVANYGIQLHNAQPQFYYIDTSSAWHIYETTIGNLIKAGSDQDVTVTYTFGTGSSIKLYIDGVLVDGSWITGNGNVAVKTGSCTLNIGAARDGASRIAIFDGAIGEVQASATIRSAGWIRASAKQSFASSGKSLFYYCPPETKSGTLSGYANSKMKSITPANYVNHCQTLRVPEFFGPMYQQHPSAIRVGDRTYIPYVDVGLLEMWIVIFDHTLQAFSSPQFVIKAGYLIWLSMWARPSIAIDSSGYIHLFWQYGDPDIYYGLMLYLKSDNPYDITSWSEGTTPASVTNVGLIHPQVDSVGNFFLIYTQKVGNLQTCTIELRKWNGSSWDNPLTGSLVDFGNLNRAVLEYSWIDSDDNIHILWNVDNNALELPNDIFYAKGETAGTIWKKADGTIIIDGENTDPIDAGTADQVIDTGADISECGTVRLDSNGYPYITFSRDAGNLRFYEYLAKWTGAAWDIKDLSLPMSTSFQARGTGYPRIDPLDDDKISIYIETLEPCQFIIYETIDGGDNWALGETISRDRQFGGSWRYKARFMQEVTGDEDSFFWTEPGADYNGTLCLFSPDYPLLKNYVVPLEVHSGAGEDSTNIVYLGGTCEVFPDDIRFTDGRGLAELDHFLESESGGVAKFWICIRDNLRTAQNFKIYWGKVGDSSASDGDKTFKTGYGKSYLFDDFSGAAIDTDKWTVGGGITQEVDSGELHAKTDSETYGNNILALIDTIQNFRIRCRIKTGDATTDFIGFRFMALNEGSEGYCVVYRGAPLGGYNSNIYPWGVWVNDGALKSFDMPNDLDSYQIMELISRWSEIKTYQNDVLEDTYAGTKEYHANQGQIRIIPYSSESPTVWRYFEWIFITQYVEGVTVSSLIFKRRILISHI